MKELTKVLRLALYVCALPLLATAVASAHNMLGTDDIDLPVTLEMDDVTSTDAIIKQRAHVLAANTDGKLAGRIIEFKNTASDLKVFFVRNGEIEQSTTTDSEGRFEATGLTAGPYSFVAAGKNGFVAHGVYVTTDAIDADEQSIAMQTAAVAPSFESVTSFIEDNAAPEVAPGQTDAIVSELAIAEIDGGNRVQLNQEGQLTGRVVSLQQRIDQTYAFGSTVAKLINDTDVETEVFINEDGTFTVNNVEPGIYDFVAAGKEGFAAVSFEAVGYEAPAAGATNAGFLRHDCCGCLDVCMTAPIDCGIVYEQVQYANDCCQEVIIDQPIIEEEIIYEEPLPLADIGCGCAGGSGIGCGGYSDFGGCGGCGGGGGGFGGMGNFGGIIGAALGAWVLTEVIDSIDDDDDGVIRQPVVVPPVIVPPATSPF